MGNWFTKKPAAAVGPPTRAAPGKVPVFVMLPLDWMSSDGSALRSESALQEQLVRLKHAGVSGVMADIWWGICEPEPGKYQFEAAVSLCKMLGDLGLKLQAVMSFHQCGGNVGDVVSIPLPSWALGPAKDEGLLYQSSAGVVSKDCLSLSADKLQVFPGNDGKRTALQCYRDYMIAFLSAVTNYMGSTICELQVGMGPCGELRYPSYLMSNGWNWPGVGLVMSHDTGMLKMLKEETGLKEPPSSLPEDQNALPESVPLFKSRSIDIAKTEFRSGPGKAFLEWYSKVLLDHGRDVLVQAADAVQQVGCTQSPKGFSFSVKISGLHWHVMHASRATEACAGYNCCTDDSANAYREIAKMLSLASQESGRPVIFNFTCMEMTNDSSAGVPESLSAPEDLIAQVRQACVSYRVPLAGENALEFDPSQGQWAFDQMRKQARSWSQGVDRMHSLTLLRLGEPFVSPCSLEKLGRFVSNI